MTQTDIDELARRYGLGAVGARIGAALASPVDREAMELQRRLGRMGVHVTLETAKTIIETEAKQHDDGK